MHSITKPIIQTLIVGYASLVSGLA
jgi:hypothetical protein